MKRWKWKKLLVIAGLILLAGLGLGYWVMNMAVNKVLDAVSSDALLAAMQTGPTASPQGTAAMPSPTPAPTPTSVAESRPSPSPARLNAAPSTGSPISNVNTPSPDSSSAPDAAAPSATPYDGTIDSAKAETAQESISLKDKLLVTSIFMKRFTSKELDAFMKLASGGLTLDEKKEAKKIVMQKLSEEEYDQLIGIAAKLGLSQGRKYEESKKDFATGQP